MCRRRAIPLVLLVLIACSPGVVVETATVAPVTSSTSTSPPTTTTTEQLTTSVASTVPPLPDLSGDLTWFAPLPPMPTDVGRPFTGSDDFMDLFAPDAPWEAVASRLDVFKLYGEWVAYHATPEQLRSAVEAADELRSVNAQIEFLLTRAVRESGRERKKREQKKDR